ncbi:MAG: protein phosphatase 2C domain-containing protein [Proteobacteria bacterium]|nr:protein phosphatase 2C domain-containing protein [Pseudomonadota bacterium]
MTLNVDILLLDDTSSPDRQRGTVGGGEFVAYTCRSPDKDTENEDTVAIISCGSQSAVLVVADGAGGLPAGKRASLTAVTTLAKSLQSPMVESVLLRTAILDGIEAANVAVQNVVNGAATTLTVIAIEGLNVRAYQIGDSEAMIVGNRGRLKFHTQVHSPTGFAVEAGFLDQHEALHHAERHLVSNFLGTRDMRIDVGTEVGLKPRDTVMIASDGLMDNVHVEEIIERIRIGSIDAAASAVIGLARRRMAGTSSEQPSKPDDLSLILYRKPGRRADKLDIETD